MRVPPHVLSLALLGALVALVSVFFLFPNVESEIMTYPELAEIDEGTPRSFQELSIYFRKLSEEKGAEYAFEVLLRASLPPDTDLHLLGHTVGSMLYKQQGIAAITTCTQDFRNACSHSVVIGILSDYGEGSLPTIAETCKEAPGGSGAYTMCFHGLGHGILAYTGYELEQAISMCKKTGTSAYRNREYIECVGGTIMEMIDGVHDRVAWEQQVERYFKDEDPLYPCSASFVPEEVRTICYDYLTPHLFTVAGGSDYSTDMYKRAFTLCDSLTGKNREACYGGFGKEFVGLAKKRDVRNIGSMTEEELLNIRTWCALADDKGGEASCNEHALASLFWGGENLPDASLIFCRIAETKEQGACYAELAGQIRQYLGNTNRGVALCGQLPDLYRKGCEESVL